MDYQRNSNGWQTFLEHWVCVLPLVLGLGVSTLLTFFTSLTGAPWIWSYAAALLIGAVSIGLLLYAKLPLYRQRRFFTFGPQALPEQRRPFYRRAYVCAVLSVALLACLLLSRH
jgi:hypothetical protein